MHYFSNKFSKIAKCWKSSLPLIFIFGKLKLCYFAKLWFSNWLWQNRTSKNQLRHHFSDV